MPIISRHEFLKLTKKRAIIKILKLINRIEEDWENLQYREEYITILKTYFDYCGEYKDEQLKRLYAFSKTDFHKMNLDAFLSIMVPLERQFNINKKDHDLLHDHPDGVRQNSEKGTLSKKLPVYLIVDNLRSTYNVGAIFRTAECFGIEKIILCGYSPTPDQLKTKKTAMGTDNYINWEYETDNRKIIKKYKKKSIPIIALETVPGSQSLHKFKFPKPCVIICGNEKYGINPSLLKMADHIIHIPLSGWKNSLNVGIASGICLYEISKQWNNQ